ncbi:MAG: serine/threonine-protein kinase [Mariprofundales bacterium]
MPDNSPQKKYSIKRKLGTGAMGEVFLARDNDLHRDVAIKRLHFTAELAAQMTDEQQQEASDRFIQEARSVARLNHSNIITIYQIVTNDEHSYIVMEYLNGKTLQSWLNDMRHFSVAAVINIGMQVAEALDYAHRAGIVHRDIKPDNIFLTSNADNPDEITVKINDFDVARMRHENGVTLFGFYNGARVLALQDGSNMPLATQANLADLTVMVSASTFKADLFSCVLQPLQEGLRHLFGKHSCNVKWNADAPSLQSLLKMRKSKLEADLTNQLHQALQLEMQEVMPNDIMLPAKAAID